MFPGQHLLHILPQSIPSTPLRYCRVEHQRAVASPSRLIAIGEPTDIEYHIISGPLTITWKKELRPFFSPHT